ncbi:hypothetical protein [Bradyrhizobium sp. Leo170]|uniref:hypothetical protein n=1 Tax=Bradyrhizobium sp. Leo170 TaxID=1571199 RepID=UPI00102E4F7B|nr:hypothetical protein [Bradyrhizobium sp. Leo170]TAI61585.1 hypothetical protein CWO89_34345 [Bradyrhizobium sp. Leo170]
MLTSTSGEQHRRPNNEPPPEAQQTIEFDWSGRLSLDTIRQHSKTDDVPGVTDEQLRLYRASAIEACERYTGLLLSGQRTVVEPVQGPASARPGKLTYRYRLQYPVADGIVYLYGSPDPADNRAFRVLPGSRSIDVPIRKDYINLSNCCDPCATWHLNGGMMIAYKAGYACVDDVPAGIVLGCLQYIAWVIEHPGDELMTQRNRIEARSVGVDGSNNVAWVSGALETWRIYDPEAF